MVSTVRLTPAVHIGVCSPFFVVYLVIEYINCRIGVCLHCLHGTFATFSLQNLMIDEADEAMPGQQSSRKRPAAESPSSPRPNKRKPGTFNNLQLHNVEFFTCVYCVSSILCKGNGSGCHTPLKHGLDRMLVFFNRPCSHR